MFLSHPGHPSLCLINLGPAVEDAGERQFSEAAEGGVPERPLAALLCGALLCAVLALSGLPCSGSARTKQRLLAGARRDADLPPSASSFGSGAGAEEAV